MSTSYTYTESGRKLSPQQLRLPFFSNALDVLGNISDTRAHVLPRLHMHASGRKVRSEVHRSIEKLAEPLLVRLDLATDTLGWVDDSGQMRVNNQQQLAADTGISPAALSRLLASHEKAGYIKRKIEKLSTRQQRRLWTVNTRTTITFTRLFYRHLGWRVYREYLRTKKWALKKRMKIDRIARDQAKQKAAQKSAILAKRIKNQRGFESWKRNADQAELSLLRHQLLAQVACDPACHGYTPNQMRLEAESRLRRQHPHLLL